MKYLEHCVEQDPQRNLFDLGFNIGYKNGFEKAKEAIIFLVSKGRTQDSFTFTGKEYNSHIDAIIEVVQNLENHPSLQPKKISQVS